MSSVSAAARVWFVQAGYRILNFSSSEFLVYKASCFRHSLFTISRHAALDSPYDWSSGRVCMQNKTTEKKTVTIINLYM